MPFPKDALNVILAYITQHTGTIGDVFKAVLDVLQWLRTTFVPNAAGVRSAAAAGFAFPVWLIPILLEILQKFLQPKTMAAVGAEGAEVKMPKASTKAKGVAKQLEKYIASDGKAA